MKAPRNIRSFARYLALYGCLSTGVLYGAIGVVALLSFLKIKHGGADESNLVAFLENFLMGRIAVWFILLGMLSYFSWRIYEALTDPYDYGTSLKGKAIRTGIALSSIADALIAYSALKALFGTGPMEESGPPRQERHLVGNVLQEGWGDWAVITLGGIILVTALVQLVYGVSGGYRERLDHRRLGRGFRNSIYFSAWYGYAARGIILGIIGFFFIKAGVTGNPHFVVNTDKAFDFIGDHVGHLYFILVAIGTIAYGYFMTALGLYYSDGR